MKKRRSDVYIKHVLEPQYTFTKEHFLGHILEINIAHITMLGKQKLVDKKEVRALRKELEDMKQKGFQKEYSGEFEDLFFMIEHELNKRLGEDVAGNLHMAFSRNDMDATMYRMFWRNQLMKWMEGLVSLRNGVLALAEQHTDTVMPAYTHGQQAQPTTLAHYLLAVEENLKRDYDRAVALYERINECPMGAVALSGTGFSVDRQFMSDRLGFTRVMGSTYDAISAGDYMLELASVISISLTTLSRFVHDLMFWASNEVDVLKLDDSLVQISSVMPQKRNPSALEHTRAFISRSFGQLRGVGDLLHNVPFGDIVDVGDDIQEGLYKGFTGAMSVVSLLTEVIGNCSFNKQLMLKRCEEGFSTTTEIADRLVREFGIPFRQAHGITALFIKELSEKGIIPVDSKAKGVLEGIVAEKTEKMLLISEALYHEMIDPKMFIAVRTTPGGPAPEEVKKQIKRAKARLLCGGDGSSAS
ncbi:argininosuccinate lyase [Alteribacter aurantiacus]|uniref:argininosuccinate lyase n=1 Tax=Alteribacter aurantiacus TaxID=254410 RepID=UPI0003FDC781|nr:argininosuccinate lyase [Alteribacter aurantiacus]